MIRPTNLAPLALGLISLAAPSTAQCLPVTNNWACESNLYWQGRSPQLSLPTPVHHDNFQHMAASVAGWGSWDGDSQPDLVMGSLPHLIEGPCPLAQPKPDWYLPYGYVYNRAYIAFGPLQCVTTPSAFCKESNDSLVVLQSRKHALDFLAPDFLGWESAIVGNLDGLGGDEIAIGAPLSDFSAANAGSAYFLFLLDKEALQAAIAAGAGPFDPEQALSTVPYVGQYIPGVVVVVVRGAATDGWFGYSIAGPGDISWNGKPDVVVGAPASGLGLDPGRFFAIDGQRLADAAAATAIGGRIVLTFGSSCSSSSVICPTAYEELTPQVAAGVGGDRFGYSVSGVGNLNNDSRNEIAIGAIQSFYECGDPPFTSAHWSKHGKGFVEVLGFNAIGDVNFKARICGEGNGDQFGASVSGLGGVSALPAGSIDSDTIPDLLVGAPFHDLVAAQDDDNGKAYAYAGASIFNGLDCTISPAPIFAMEGDVRGELLGWKVAGGGPAGGSGNKPDFAISAKLYSLGVITPPACSNQWDRGNKLGRVVVICGNTLAPITQITGEQYGQQLGFDIAWAGLMDANASPDLFIGGPSWEPCADCSGAPPTCCDVEGQELGRGYVFLR